MSVEYFFVHRVIDAYGLRHCQKYEIGNRVHTLHAFSNGSRKDVLKKLMDFSRDILSQSETHNRIVKNQAILAY